MSNEVNMPTIPLTVVANPITEPTAEPGKRSEATVKIFADHELWAAAARAINATHQKRESRKGTIITGKTRIALVNKVIFRAKLAVFPILNNHDDMAPPASPPQ